MAKAPAIQDYHAHVYFDADSREPATALREEIETHFDIEMGRWHEKEVGPPRGGVIRLNSAPINSPKLSPGSCKTAAA
jgi:DOPA 4,5-dioxygenase